jgi:hypothetical protein
MGGQERLNHRDLDETRKTVKSGEAKKTLVAFGQFIAKAEANASST